MTMWNKQEIRLATILLMVMGLILVFGGAGLAVAQEPCGDTNPNPEGPPFNPENVCAENTPQVGPVTNPAMQDPDQFAWQKFAELNRPAADGSDQPLWRTWPEQAELYVANPDPNNPPKWEDVAGLDEAHPVRPSVQLNIQQTAAISVAHKPEDCPEMPEEVRLNQEHFDYVIANDLWYIEGKAEAFKNDLEVSFPTGAIEVKANWKQVSPEESEGFYTTLDSQGNTWALIAMHIMTKDIPNWLWATFEHESNPCYSKFLQAQDTFGLQDGEPSSQLLDLFEQNGLDPDIWGNYRLDGAQVTFTNDVGRPIILGNSVTEKGFQTTSSCMTCHARATTDASGSKHLSVFDEHSQSFHGIPDPKWYFTSFRFDPPSRAFLPLDFSWAVAICPNAIGSTDQNCKLPGFDEVATAP